MKKEHQLIPLFKQFIKETETGKRLKKNGEKIKPESIDNYRYLLHNLIQFSTQQKFELRICEANKLNKRELLSEKNYWKKFYQKFTDFFYKKGCHDNYVGANMKIFRVFFNYLKNDKDFATGDFQRLFYVRKEEIDILVLSPDQLKFLIHDTEFDTLLTGRDDFFFQPISLKVAPFRIFGFQKCHLMKTDLCDLFHHPFHSIRTFGRSDGEMDLKIIFLRLCFAKNFQAGFFDICVQNHRLVNHAFSISQGDCISLFFAEHSD